jgi:hypothetical protein
MRAKMNFKMNSKMATVNNPNIVRTRAAESDSETPPSPVLDISSPENDGDLEDDITVAAPAAATTNKVCLST